MFNKTSLVEKMGVYWMICLMSYLWLAVMIACGLVVCGFLIGVVMLFVVSFCSGSWDIVL